MMVLNVSSSYVRRLSPPHTNSACCAVTSLLVHVPVPRAQSHHSASQVRRHTLARERPRPGKSRQFHIRIGSEAGAGAKRYIPFAHGGRSAVLGGSTIASGGICAEERGENAGGCVIAGLDWGFTFEEDWQMRCFVWLKAGSKVQRRRQCRRRRGSPGHRLVLYSGTSIAKTKPRPSTDDVTPP